MKAKIKSEEFMKKVQLVALAAANKLDGVGTEILSCLKIIAREKEIEIVGVNHVWSMVKRFEAEVAEPGMTTVMAKILAEVVSFCKDEYTQLETVRGKLRIHSGAFLIELSTLPAYSFPALEPEDVEYFIQMPATQLRSMIKAVTSSAAGEDNRPMLSGTLLKTETGEGKSGALTLAAADGFRLAEEQWPIEIPSGMKEICAVVPAKAFEKLTKHLEEEGTVVIALTVKGKIQLRYNGTTIMINPLSGAFPDYRPIIPTQASTIAAFDVESSTGGFALRPIGRLARGFSNSSGEERQGQCIPGSCQRNRARKKPNRRPGARGAAEHPVEPPIFAGGDRGMQHPGIRSRLFGNHRHGKTHSGDAHARGRRQR